MINHPSHYQMKNGIEVIDVIRGTLDDGFASYCLGNVIKYVCRSGKKTNATALEDLKKAAVYLNWLIEIKESEDMKDGTESFDIR